MMQLFTWLLTALSLIGVVMNIRKKREYVGKDTEEDCAYNRGIDDCITAIREKFIK